MAWRIRSSLAGSPKPRSRNRCINDHQAAHAAIVRDVQEIRTLKAALARASGRQVTLLERQLSAVVSSLQERFDALWGFSTQMQHIRLPGE